MPRRNPTRFNVRPYHSCGSPAQVDEATALRVAQQEVIACHQALEGIYGENHRIAALDRGLTFLAYTMVERRKGWEVYDLITGQLWFWPFKAACDDCGSKGLDVQRGRLPDHDCTNDGNYVGTRLTDKESQHPRYGTEVV